jgi:hypothetical protein
MIDADIPEIRTEKGFTLVKAVVALENGLGPKELMAVHIEARKFERKVEIRKNNFGLEISRTFLTNPEIYHGDHVDILVKGEDTKAKSYALRVYSALTSENLDNLNFERITL